MSDLKTGNSVGINTNEDVLKYFEQYGQGNKIARWRETGKVETNDTFHFLDEENPERLALILNKEFNADILVESFDVCKRETVSESKNIKIE